jgi:PKD repeat protein
MKKGYLLLVTALSLSLPSVFGQVQQANPSINKIEPTVSPKSPMNLPSNSKKHASKTVVNGNVGFGTHTCKSHELNEQHYAERGILEEFNQSYYNSTATMQVPSTMRTPGVNTISVIFHVVYNPNNPAENVSNALIMQVYNDIVQDFQLLNADAANARGGFGFVPADANINFCLATKTPTGVPLTEVGVVRVSTTEEWYNSDGGEENKMKASATGGSQIWDRNQYLNVWICDISNGANSGTAGYAYRPTTTFLPSASIDGIVLDYNLGMNNDNVLTHEIGHYLGLDHTWGGSGSCTLDDGFTDTPNTAGPSFNYPGSCSGNQSTCSGVQTQYENYMDYSNCTVMFTQNQSDYMLTILGGIRSSLLLSPGCDPVNAPPVANFSADIGTPIIIPAGGTVNFYDQSTNVPTSWSWNFGGGSTNQSVQNPTAVFNTVGTYTVTLTAGNAYGSDSEVKTGYVQVVAAAAGTACDTLRNYNPVTESLAAYITEFTGWNDWGYFPGTGAYDYPPLVNTTMWADRYVATSSTQVRRLIFPILQATNLTGTGIMKIRVHGETSGSPGAVLTTDTLLIADMNEGAYNTFDFTTPPTVTGAFWVSFELFYGTPQDTVILACVDFTDRATGLNTMKLFNNNVWNTPASLYGASWKSSLWLDVLTSNGPAPVADFSANDDQVCVGGQISVNGSLSTNTTFYDWYLTDDPYTTTISNSNAISNTYTFPTAGNYAIYLFADGSCKTDGVYLPVDVNALPTATVTATSTTCGNNNGTITATGAAGGFTPYYYSLDGVNYQTTSTFNNLAAGTYTVHVATLGNNCESTYTVTVNGSSAISPTVSPNTAVCPGGPATITASGGISYTWYNGSSVLGTTASLNVTPGASTQYTCVVTSGACSGTVYTTVTVNPLSNASFTFNDFCLGAANAATAIATPGGTFSFNPAPSDGATINSTTGEISNETLGTTYSIQYAVAGTCPNSQIETVSVNSNDNASFTTANWCVGGTHAVSGIITPGGTFAFNPVPSDGATINATTGVISNAVVGNSYTIQYTTPTGVCQSSSTQSVSYNANPTVDAGTSQTVCQGQSVTLIGSGSATSYTWNNGVNNGVAFTASTVGTTTYTVTGTLNGCTTTDVVNVTVNAGPTVDAGTSQTICNDGSQVTLTGTGNATSYSWNNGVTDGVAFTPSVGTTTYTVTGTLAGCTSTDQVTVTNNALPTVTLANFSTVCANWDPFLLTGGSPAGGIYSGTNVSSNVFDPITAGVGSTTITYTYTDGNNCTNTAQNTITVDACASIEEVNAVVAAIYPNPTKGNVTIELKGNFEYEVLDTRGRLISMGSATDLIDLNITNFKNGVYMIKIKHDQFENSYRVIKQ